MRAIYFDIDDTLVNTSAMRDGIRRPFTETCERLMVAPAIPSMVALCQEWADKGYAIVLITARAEWMREGTMRQIESLGINAHLYMRAEGDNRVDYKVKSDLMADVINDGYVIECGYDDKAKNRETLAAWFPCWDVQA